MLVRNALRAGSYMTKLSSCPTLTLCSPARGGMWDLDKGSGDAAGKQYQFGTRLEKRYKMHCFQMVNLYFFCMGVPILARMSSPNK